MAGPCCEVRASLASISSVLNRSAAASTGSITMHARTMCAANSNGGAPSRPLLSTCFYNKESDSSGFWVFHRGVTSIFAMAVSSQAK